MVGVVEWCLPAFLTVSFLAATPSSLEEQNNSSWAPDILCPPLSLPSVSPSMLSWPQEEDTQPRCFLEDARGLLGQH